MIASGKARARQLCAELGKELDSPLGAVLRSVTEATDSTAADDPRRSCLESAVRELERLRAILGSFVDYGEAAAPRCHPCDLSALFRRIVEGHGSDRIELALPPEPMLADVDSALVERAITSLVDDAFAAGASRVHVQLEVVGATAVCHVADDGPRMTAEARETMFEPFGSGRGRTGPELARTRDIVEAHGGCIDLVPGPQAGACFRLALPLGREARISR